MVGPDPRAKPRVQHSPFPSLRPQVLTDLGVFLYSAILRLPRPLPGPKSPRTEGDRVKSTDLRANMGIKLDNKLYLITKLEHRTPGNLRAFIQVTIRDLNSGAIIEKRLRSGEEVEQVDLDRRPMEYLYEQSGKHVFMDLESYEQVELAKAVVGDMTLYVLPNSQIIVLWCDGKAISVEMPLVVTLTITDTPPGIKGATATNQLKEATCETGLKTRVPPFITTGEKVIISTADGSYRSRA